jgi:hypothetical protein
MINDFNERERERAQAINVEEGSMRWGVASVQKEMNDGKGSRPLVK